MAAVRPGSYIVVKPEEGNAWVCCFVAALAAERVCLWRSDQPEWECLPVGDLEWRSVLRHGLVPGGLEEGSTVEWFPAAHSAKEKKTLQEEGAKKLSEAPHPEPQPSLSDDGAAWVNITFHSECFGAVLRPADVPVDAVRAGPVDMLFEGEEEVVHLRKMTMQDAGTFLKTFVVQDQRAEEPTPMSAADPRVLPKKVNAVGKPYLRFDDAIVALTQDEDTFFPFGVRSTLRVLHRYVSHGGSVMEHHSRWLRDSKIAEGRRERMEHQELSEILDLMIQYDQLNVPNLASAEKLLRRLQVIEAAVNANKDRPDYSVARYLSADEVTQDGAILDDDLAKLITQKRGQERKFRKEERPGAKAPPSAKQGAKKDFWKKKKKTAQEG